MLDLRPGEAAQHSANTRHIYPQLHRKKNLCLVRMGTNEALIPFEEMLFGAAVVYQIRAGREAREILEFVGQMGLIVVTRR